jgi:hypothetical protein
MWSTDNFGFLWFENEHTIGAANELGSIRKTQLMFRQVISLTWFVLAFGRKVYRRPVCKKCRETLGTATG